VGSGTKSVDHEICEKKHLPFVMDDLSFGCGSFETTGNPIKSRFWVSQRLPGVKPMW
jgi:hypothetical protein